MKRCPYCSEEIQDEAIKCRYCGSDLSDARVGGESSPASVTSVEPPLSLSHMGTRYGLGAGVDYFGIWDTLVPGRPVNRFPRTDDGWRQAWAAFGRLEPTAVPTSPMSVADPGTAPSGAAGFATAQRAMPQGNGAAVASLVLGIVGFVLAWLPAIGLILGILAIVFAYLGFKRADQTGSGRGLAIAGLVLGILATLYGLLVVAFFGTVSSSVGHLKP